MNNKKIKAVGEEKADELYDSVRVCTYCGTPFRDCDTVIPGKGILVGETDVVKYKNRFWHFGCVLDFEKSKIGDIN